MSDEHAVNKPTDKPIDKPVDKQVIAPAKPVVAPAVAPVHGDDDAKADPYAGTPYTGPSEIVPGGRYVRKARLVRGKLMGGEVVNAHGEVLATFADDQENTARPEDGKKPE